MTAGAGRASIAATTAVALILSSMLAYFMLVSNRNGALCKTKECVNAASRIINAMDKSYDPCNEFYKFSCAGWLRDNPIPDDASRITQFVLTFERAQKVLKTLLSSNPPNDREAIKKTKLYYRACTNEDGVEKLGAKPALDMIDRYGGLPLFGHEFDDKTFSLERLLATAKNGNSLLLFSIPSPLINMEVRPDEKNSSFHVITVDQPLLGIANEKAYTNKKLNATVNAYRQFLEDYLAELWKSASLTNRSTAFDEEAVKKAVDEIIELETDLSKIIEKKEARMDVLKIYNKMTIEDMSKNLSADFDWYKFLSGIMKRVDIELDSTTNVIVRGLPYLSKMMSVLNNYSKRILQNYVIIYNLRSHVALLSKKFRDTRMPFRKVTLGTDKEKPTWKTCISAANSLLPLPVGALFVESMFSEKSRDVTIEMTNNVIDSFKKILSTIDWMDESTKEFAMKKADFVSELIGYPGFIVDEEDPRLDEYYEDVVIVEDNLFESEHNLYNFHMERNLKKFNKPVDRQEWEIGPGEVNAFYDRSTNQMVFPVGILQVPFFDPGQPYAMNYGGIGVVIGHELTHGFDLAGSRYNNIGNLENWWTNSSRDKFEDKASCLKRQYGTFYYEKAEMYLNGNTTIGENVADNGGIRLTYNGYQLWKLKNQGKEFKLPGLEEYTPEQLFFIGNAQLWCAADRPELAKRWVALASHSPAIFRVEGTFRNFEKFGEAFGCKIGEDKLYPKPENTCRVW